MTVSAISEKSIDKKPGKDTFRAELLIDTMNWTIGYFDKITVCSKKDGTILTLFGSLLNFVYVLNYLLMKVADQITVCSLS